MGKVFSGESIDCCHLALEADEIRPTLIVVKRPDSHEKVSFDSSVQTGSTSHCA